MKIAILVTNTDTSEFADRHPGDGDKFTGILLGARPDWDIEVFQVKDGEFPNELGAFDGFVITGSPASVHDTSDWIGTLLDLIRDVHSRGKKMFGACFGHQAIAVALGGKVDFNPNGWTWGRIETTSNSKRDWIEELPESLGMYAAHIEQVSQLPAGADNLFVTKHCPNAGFAIGQNVYTTQYHPEMTRDFVEDLTQEVSAEIGEDVAAAALESLSKEVDSNAYVETVARFFEG